MYSTFKKTFEKLSEIRQKTKTEYQGKKTYIDIDFDRLNEQIEHDIELMANLYDEEIKELTSDLLDCESNQLDCESNQLN